MSTIKMLNACYSGIDNVTKKTIINTKEYNEALKKANEKIKENQSRYATAYKNARDYLGKI